MSQQEQMTPSSRDTSWAEKDIFMGGVAVAGGLGFTALQTIHAFRENDLSSVDLAITVGTSFVNGGLVAVGGMLTHSGIRLLRTSDRQQG